MSYVLDALKKAEKERRHQTELGLDNLEQDDWVKPHESKSPTRSIKPLGFFGIFVGILVIISVANLTTEPEIVGELDTVSSTEQSASQIIAISRQANSDERENPDIFEQSEPEIPQKLDLESQINEFRFEGSLYIEGNLEASRVFVDGQAYFIGDVLKNEVYIKDITPDSVALSNGYEEVIRALR